MIGENPRSNEDEPEIRILSGQEDAGDDIEVRILSENREGDSDYETKLAGINEYYDGLKREVDETIQKLFGAGDTFVENVKNTNEKSKEENDLHLSIKEKIAALIADENAKNEKARRDAIKALKR
ncbi:MAG: hypothetical protein Q8O66_02055 [bacterium]|nr:hypothetical protein [bacterium]